MPTSHPHTDLLLEGAQHKVPHRLIDGPRVDSEPNPDGSFDWKPTVLLVAIGTAALLAFAYL